MATPAFSGPVPIAACPSTPTIALALACGGLWLSSHHSGYPTSWKHVSFVCFCIPQWVQKSLDLSVFPRYDEDEVPPELYVFFVARYLGKLSDLGAGEWRAARPEPISSRDGVFKVCVLVADCKIWSLAASRWTLEKAASVEGMGLSLSISRQTLSNLGSSPDKN